MKKKIVAFFAAVMILISFVGCGEKNEVIIDTAVLAKELSKLYEGGEVNLVKLEKESADMTYGLAGLYTSLYAEASVTATADQFLVMEALDEENAEKAVGILEEYLDSKIQLFASYGVNEVPKFEEALLELEGKYIVFAVASDVSEAKNIWNRYAGD